ncbi:MAG TPA: sugar phosphate isomerase/epimerase, partial [Candidatus Hydrogenedentes bacterium]|nr:sugar phosphate isomerase/epimerase [Candidatus Hydrogenedentota bacterium]
MKIAINQWAFPGAMPATEAIDIAKRIGFEAFEICIGDEGPVRLDATESDIIAIRRHAEKAEIALTSVGSGMGWKHALCSPDVDERTRAKDTLDRLLHMAQWLGVDCVLTVPGSVTPGVPYDAAIEHALASVQDVVPTAEKLRVSIAIENVWNKFLLSPIEMRDFIDQCESEFVGAYFDTGNVIL